MTPPSDHVLVVEDERDLADLYATWLEERYRVTTAYNGERALSVLDGSVDVVLLDRRMPDLSGDEVLSRIREGGYDCRVAMVTAVEPDFDIVDMGFDDYFVKPVTREELADSVERLITRNTYNEKLDRFAQLISKKTALETEKTASELEDSEEFERLQREIEEIRADIDPIAQGFGEEDIAAVLRDVPASSGT